MAIRKKAALMVLVLLISLYVLSVISANIEGRNRLGRR